MFIEKNSKPTEKLKAWYLFTEDFIAGTQHLSNEEIGIYIRLLCWNWNKRCSGILNNENTYYRIGNCITDSEKESCKSILKQFFVLIGSHFQNERQLQEYLYITKRIDASKVNGKLGGRPKKPRNNPPTPTTTPTSTKTTTKTKVSKTSNFNKFWNKIPNKVSKGIAEKNFLKLEPEWLENPEHLADMYKNYYESIEDKQFAKQPAFWLSAKKYLDEQPKKKKDNSPADPYKNRVNMFKEAIEAKNGTAFIRGYAQRYPSDVERAIGEGQFTKEQAKQYLDFRG
jgi:uncharacterized protein YdaU (DUF1376 family)